jgi:hypothetical protein
MNLEQLIQEVKKAKAVLAQAVYAEQRKLIEKKFGLESANTAHYGWYNSKFGYCTKISNVKHKELHPTILTKIVAATLEHEFYDYPVDPIESLKL